MQRPWHKDRIDPDLIISDKSKSILQGAIRPWSGHFFTFRSSMLKDVGKRFGFDLNTPISRMTETQVRTILYGTRGEYPLQISIEIFGYRVGI